MHAMLQPITINREEMGLDAMAEVGPGGHFFGAAHTMSRYKTAFYEPILSDWQNNENWQIAGAQDATRRATDLWQRVVAEFQAPALDVARRDALLDYVDRRKKALGKEEPKLELFL